MNNNLATSAGSLSEARSFDELNTNNALTTNRVEILASILNRIQSYVRSSYPRSLTPDAINERDVKSFILMFVRDNKVTMDGFTGKELIDRVYWEMVEYSVITPYLNDINVEEININSWDAIRIQWRGGKTEILRESFLSAIHARDIIVRLLQSESEILLDENMPIVRGHLRNNIRISAASTPILDSIRGVQASIRIINPTKMKKHDFIKAETLTTEMFLLLSVCLSHTVSICLSGATDSGKTTLMSGILSEFPKDRRIITIEEQTREFDLVHFNAEGIIDNNVVHWVTHGEYDMSTLLSYALTNHPHAICMGELKSKEAYASLKAARTGHAVITNTHTDSCRGTYKRIVELCQESRNISFETLYASATEAFPIVVHTQKLNDNSRKVMEITECIQNDDNSITINTLYEYDVELNDFDDQGNPIVVGKFIKRNNISKALQKKFKSNGLSTSVLETLLRGEVT